MYYIVKSCTIFTLTIPHSSNTLVVVGTQFMSTVTDRGTGVY
jgi:hypothetical protein